MTSAHSPPCPFPSPGGLQKELPERRSSLTQLSHPLLASTRSDVHRNADKLLHERMSHPEFHIAKRDVPITNRAKSSNDVFFSTSTKRESRERVPVFSPSRERINSLATVLCDTLEPDSHTQCHPSLQTSPSLHPLLRGVRASLGTLAHHFGLTPDHQKCLSDLVLTPPPSSLPQSSFSSLDSSLSSLQSLQEVEYEIIEGPLKMNVWRDDGGKEVYATMVFKVQLCDALVQLRSHMNKGDIALLKVGDIVRETLLRHTCTHTRTTNTHTHNKHTHAQQTHTHNKHTHTTNTLTHNIPTHLHTRATHTHTHTLTHTHTHTHLVNSTPQNSQLSTHRCSLLYTTSFTVVIGNPL